MNVAKVCACLFPINEAALPDFKIDQRPEPLVMIFAAQVAGYYILHIVCIEDVALAGSRTEHIVVNEVTESAAQPIAYGNREAHLPACENLFRQTVAHGPPQDVFR